MADREGLDGFAGLRAKPQRGLHASGESAVRIRPVRLAPPPVPPKEPRSSTLQLWMRGFAFGLVLWGLGLLALAVGADIGLP